ncbi:MAG TPA: mechanosensitive ion channel family protein [Thermoanaerobaculia bacterium]|nr:mechanosensitive ion channel family protein [Thermoanaerobaculia bacterium]
MRRFSRLVVPFVLSVMLIVLWAFVRARPSLFDPTPFDPVQGTKVLLFVAFLPIVFLIVRLMDIVAFEFVAARRRQLNAPTLLRELLSIAVFFLMVWLAYTAIFQKSVAFLATGTVVAAILGLALQETLGNLFAGIALHLEDTFDAGDVIRTGEVMGVVESVRWRGTRIRTFNNNVVIVPNSLMARERLEVFARKGLNGRVLQINVDYNIDPATVIGVMQQAASNVDGVSHDLPCFARVGGFTESAMVYEIKYFTHDYSQRDRIDADIRKAVWYAFRRNGITVGFPVRIFQRAPKSETGQSPDPNEIADRLARVDVLSPLSRAAHEAMAAAARVRVYSRGETIIRRGDEGSSMFILHKGEVSVRVDDEVVASLEAGDFFGEMALLTGEARTADVVALNDVVVVEIAKEALQPILRDHPDLAGAISARVLERRGGLDAHRHETHEEEHKTILSRMRAYFGL